LKNSSYDSWQFEDERKHSYDLQFWFKTTETADKNKIHMVRQKAILDISAEEFCEVNHDIDLQVQNNSSITSWKRLAEYKTKEINIEIGQIISPKIIIIDPREVVYLKYCKIDREKGTLVNIKKSIVLKD